MTSWESQLGYRKKKRLSGLRARQTSRTGFKNKSNLTALRIGWIRMATPHCFNFYPLVALFPMRYDVEMDSLTRYKFRLERVEWIFGLKSIRKIFTVNYSYVIIHINCKKYPVSMSLSG